MLAAALLIALAAPSDGLPPAARDPFASLCHMGECVWFAELSRETMRETIDGRLLRLELLGGESAAAPGEEYDRAWGPEARVAWSEERFTVWLFCSPRLPAAIWPGPDGAATAELLNFPGASPANQASSRSLYAHVCHGGEFDAERLGYRVPPAGEIDIADPRDIFDRLP